MWEKQQLQKSLRNRSTDHRESISDDDMVSIKVDLDGIALDQGRYVPPAKPTYKNIKQWILDIEAPDLTVKDRLIYAKDQVTSTFKKVFPYILIGVGIGTLIHNWIPESWIQNILGSSNPFGVILATLIGVPMYADIFGTIPVAEALLAKGALLGTILNFMMAVTTLSLPSLIMLKKAIKPKLLGTFIAICTMGIIIVGYGFNVFQNLFI